VDERDAIIEEAGVRKVAEAIWREACEVDESALETDASSYLPEARAAIRVAAPFIVAAECRRVTREIEARRSSPPVGDYAEGYDVALVDVLDVVGRGVPELEVEEDVTLPPTRGRDSVTVRAQVRGVPEQRMVPCRDPRGVTGVTDCPACGNTGLVPEQEETT
jgi:hypothetical protein